MKTNFEERVTMKNADPNRYHRTERARSLMEMLPISFREFCKKSGIPYATLQHWISVDKNGMPESAVKEFIKKLTTFGIHCSFEWLAYGTGPQPQALNFLSSASHSIKEEQENNKSTAEMDQISTELSFFMHQNKDAMDFVVPDDTMEPRFIKGEIVAGIRCYNKIEKLMGTDCIVLLENGDVYLRTIRQGSLPGRYNLTHTNLQTTEPVSFFNNVKLVSAAPIIWARRKKYYNFSR